MTSGWFLHASFRIHHQYRQSLNTKRQDNIKKLPHKNTAVGTRRFEISSLYFTILNHIGLALQVLTK